MIKTIKNLTRSILPLVMIIMTLVMVVAISKPINAAVIPVTNEVELNNALNNSTNSDTITLANDIEVVGITIPNGKELTLSGNHKLIGTTTSATITLNGNTKLTIDGPTITHDSSVIGTATTRGVNLSGSTNVFTLVSGSISNNVGVAYGAGIYAPASSSGTIINIKGGQITNNVTTTGHGGGIFSSSATINVSGGVIANNEAAAGAGIFSDQTVNITGGEIHDNAIKSASTSGITKNGGGVHARNLNMSAGKIYNNTANYGGGIYGLSGGIIDISGGEIYNNDAIDSGGGIYGRVITISGDSYIHDNASNFGGGVFGVTTTNVSGGVIANNHGRLNCGGIYIQGTLTMTSGTVSGNTSDNNGGGIFISAAGSVDLSNVTISENTAANYGGGLYLQGNLNMASVVSSRITKNTADVLAGGVYITANNTVNISETILSENEAGAQGGAIMNLGTLYLTNMNLSNNIANYGGALLTGGPVNVLNSSFEKNSATASFDGVTSTGGAIYTTNYNNLLVDSKSTFIDNIAQFGYKEHTATLDLIYDTQIKATTWTTPFTQGYNNYDINFLGENVVHPVTFHMNNGVTDIITTVLVTEGESIGDAMISNPTWSGYEFIHWNTNVDGSGTIFSKDSPIVKPTHVHAQWQVLSSDGDNDNVSPTLDKKPGESQNIVSTANSAQSIPNTGSVMLMVTGLVAGLGVLGITLGRKLKQN